MYLSCDMRNPQFNLQIYDKLAVVNCILEKSDVKNYLLRTLFEKDQPELDALRRQSAIEILKLKK